MNPWIIVDGHVGRGDRRPSRAARALALLLLQACLAFALPVADAASQAGPATDHAFLELDSPRTSYFVHEPIPVHLRLGLDADFLAARMIPLFRRPMDVPVQLQAGWIDALPGAIALPAPDGNDQGPTLAVNDSLDRARRLDDRLVGGRRFTVLELERRYLAEFPGELSIPAPSLRFAYATSFRDDAIAGRISDDRHEALVSARPLTLKIVSLPEEGRPPGFGGAVGNFSLQARARPLELAAGESLELALIIEGTGNLAQLEPPRLSRLPGFSVYGRGHDDIEGSRRTITYTLSPRSESVSAIPSIPFVCFVPGPSPAYRTLTTEPIPLTVRPAPTGGRAVTETPVGETGGTRSPPANGAPGQNLPDGPGEPEPGAFSALPVLLLFLLLAAIVIWRRLG